MDVYIKINDPILRSYIGALFEKKKNSYLVTTKSLTGAAICTLVLASDIPVNVDRKDKTAMLFMLPRSRYNDNLRGRFLYVTDEAEQKINLSLKKEFETNYLTYITTHRMLGMQMKDIIPLFIYEHNLSGLFDGDIETLKKRYYRKELELLKNLQETLRKKAYYLLKKAVS